MAKLTIIYGKQGAGKTRRATELASQRKAFWTSGYRIDHQFVFGQLFNEEFDCVVIDELPVNKIDKIFSWINQKQLLVECLGKVSKNIKTPDFIVILSNDLEVDIEVINIGAKQAANAVLQKEKPTNWFWKWIGRISVWAEAKDKKAMTDILESERKIKQMERDIEWIKKTGKPYSSDRKEASNG